ncbi:hypothetical protein B0H13DRAFT_2357504 [Mycena leptocephala]|nr:hypothetical protein B0H13DRAFT_2357504 [Mycena leptocephala]
MPSPVRKTASRKALVAENDQLHSLLKGVGYDLDHSYGHMVLMEHENKNMRQQLFAKKNKAKRAYTTGKACLMTSTEMQEELLKVFQKKQMAKMHAGLKKLFPAIKKQISEALKAEKAATKKGEQEVRAAAKAAEKAAKELEKAATGCQWGGARGGRRRGVRGSGAVWGVGRGRGKAQDNSDEGGQKGRVLICRLAVCALQSWQEPGPEGSTGSIFKP